MTQQPPVRTRFAPSPTGHLHVGGARTALFNWAYARAHGGQFILRIEDTDQKRSSDSASMAFLEDLRWLGINWDEGPEHEDCGGGDRGPYYQAQRLDTYRDYMETLIDQGRAYRAFETPEELDAARAIARAEKKDYRYDRAALALDEGTIAKYLAEGRPYVVRFKVPDEADVLINDEIRGEVTVSTRQLDDFVIRKADGFPTYHFAVVVDDELMGITHVIRGEEHLYNTPRHALLQDAMGFRRPVYAHLSLIFNPDGSKMSKRDKDKSLRAEIRKRGVETSSVLDEPEFRGWLGAKDQQLDLNTAEALAVEIGIALPEINVDDFRKAGYLPEVMVNYLALLGWNPGNDVEKFDREFLVQHFSFDRMIKSAAKFDRDKLLAFSLDAIQDMPAEEFAGRYLTHLGEFHPEFTARLDETQLSMLAMANQGRAKTLEDTIAGSRFFIEPDDSIDIEVTKPVRKALINGDPNGLSRLEAVLPLLRDLSDWNSDTIEKIVSEHADQSAEGKLGKIAQPLRIAVSGGTISPAIFETLAILGRDSTINRIERCLNSLKQATES